MSKTTAVRTTAPEAKASSSQRVRPAGRADPALDALQAKANESRAAFQLMAVQRQADNVVQREEEDYDDGYDGDDEAAEPMTLIASMVGDKIGSVYIGSGRVRTTHKSGPTAEQHDERETIRFHIDKAAARKAFIAAVPDYKDRKKHPKGPSKTKKHWIGRTLAGATPETVPAWATLVPDADHAFSSATDAGATGKQLFEVFTKAGVYSGCHPSRGVAVRFETDSDTMATLRAAATAVSKIEDVKAKNGAFYDYLVENAPEFAAMIRTPDEITY